MKLNQKDLLLQAEILGLALPENMEPEEIIKCVKRHSNGEKIDIVKMYHPFMELRTAMMKWVEDHFNTISAQHKGEPDCIACPTARLVGCFMENRKRLERGGYINQDDPWMLK